MADTGNGDVWADFVAEQQQRRKEFVERVLLAVRRTQNGFVYADDRGETR